jgi:hypothetical protein
VNPSNGTRNGRWLERTLLLSIIGLLVTTMGFVFQGLHTDMLDNRKAVTELTNEQGRRQWAIKYVETLAAGQDARTTQLNQLDYLCKQMDARVNLLSQRMTALEQAQETVRRVQDRCCLRFPGPRMNPDAPEPP